MKRITLTLLMFILLIPTGCNGLDLSISDNNVESTASQRESVTIDRVIDGDTVSVRFEDGRLERVRLLLIDTPESVHPEKEAQPFGEESSNYAKEFLQEGIDVELEKGDPERDKYDRLLAYIWLNDINVNQLMIEKGYARVAYVYEPNTKYLDDFKKAEEKARSEGKKIWSIDGYVESQFEDY